MGFAIRYPEAWLEEKFFDPLDPQPDKTKTQNNKEK